MYTVYSKQSCSFCVQAKKLLASKGLHFTEKVIFTGEEKQPGVEYIEAQELKKLVPTAKTVPQIFHNDTLIGGFTELKAHLANESS